MIFGMPVKDELPERAIPVEAVAIVKYLDEDGDACWLLTSTENLQDMECLGMLHAGEHMQMKDIADRFEDAGEE